MSSRYRRQVVLPELGDQGQARFAAADVAVGTDDPAGRVCALYLAGAGVGQLWVPHRLVEVCVGLNSSIFVGGIDPWGPELRFRDHRFPWSQGAGVDEGARVAGAVLRLILER